MFISIVEGKEGIQEIEVVKAEETKHIFPKSLLSATMQDGSIRERKACRYTLLSESKIVNSIYFYSFLISIFYFLFIFLFLDLRLEINMTLHMTITHLSYICHIL